MKITDITPTIRRKEEKIRLAAYVRVSSDSQDQLHSFATQIQYYSDYVKTHPEYELVDIYADEGLTGTEMDNRDELNRLVSDCKRGKIDRVIVKSISRLARNTEELLITIRMIKDFGASLYFEEQDIDTEKLNMEMIVTFPGMAAQQESEAISGNLRWSYRKRMESGEFNCCYAAYGFKLVNNKLQIVEEEAKVVKRIFDMYLQGIGIQMIANILNEEEIPKRNRRNWCKTSVKYILLNERYMGDAILQKYYTTETLPFKQMINKGHLPKYYVENSNPPIVSKEVFKAVQLLMKEKQTLKTVFTKYPLSSKLRCPECGGMYRRHCINGKTYWMCMKTASQASNCKSGRIKETSVYEAFVKMIYKLKYYRKQIIEELINQIENLQTYTGVYQERIKQIDKEIADYSAKNHIVTRLHTNGILNAIDFSKQISDINNKIAELRKERKEKLRMDTDESLLCFSYV